MKHAKCRMNPVAGVLLAVLLLWQAGLSGCDFSAPALYTATYMDVFETVLTLRIASTSHGGRQCGGGGTRTYAGAAPRVRHLP